MSQKRGLDRFSKLPNDGDPWAPNNLVKPGAKEKHQLNLGLCSKRRLYTSTAAKINIEPVQLIEEFSESPEGTQCGLNINGNISYLYTLYAVDLL